MFRRIIGFSTIACAVLLGIASPAQAQREIRLDADSSWTHPHSNIVIPADLVGLKRGRVVEFSNNQLNMGFSFVAPDNGEEISLYIYRNTNGDIPVWFEQAKRGLESRDLFGTPRLALDVAPYTWPKNEQRIGLRAFYNTPGSQFSTSTGLALFSIDGWYVKVRATSTSKSAIALSALVDTALAEVSLPLADHADTEPIPVVPCAANLEFKKKAKDAKRDASAGILGALLGSVVAEKRAEAATSDKPKVATKWCRDGEIGQMRVAYRADASTDSYLLALGDSGIGISVGPDVSGLLLSDDAKSNQKTNYSITLITEDKRINYVPQNRLPSFKRTMKVVEGGRQTSATTTWGDDNTIEINTSGME